MKDIFLEWGIYYKWSEPFNHTIFGNIFNNMLQFQDVVVAVGDNMSARDWILPPWRQSSSIHLTLVVVSLLHLENFLETFTQHDWKIARHLCHALAVYFDLWFYINDTVDACLSPSLWLVLYSIKLLSSSFNSLKYIRFRLELYLFFIAVMFNLLYK